MRTSAGFCEIGFLGEMGAPIPPPPLAWRRGAPPRWRWGERARRAASIWRAVRRPRSVAFRPKSPNDTFAPRVATPVLRPFCSLRYFLRAGCSILYSPLASGVGALRTRLTAGDLAGSPAGAADGAAA